MKILNCQTLGEICEAALDGEPVFVVRAQDSCSLLTLRNYIQHIRSHGGKNVGRSEAMLERFIKWQKENPSKVKSPD